MSPFQKPHGRHGTRLLQNTPFLLTKINLMGIFTFTKKGQKANTASSTCFAASVRGSVHRSSKSGPTKLPGKHSRSSNEAILCSHLVVTMRCYSYQVACRKMDFGICFS